MTNITAINNTTATVTATAHIILDISGSGFIAHAAAMAAKA